MKHVRHSTFLFASALTMFVPPGPSANGGGCTSTIISYDDKKCVYTSYSCTDHQCIFVGQECQSCSAALTNAFCVTENNSRCLELRDCDGCGVIVKGICEVQGGVLVCGQTVQTNSECLRNWCTNLPMGEP